MRPLRALALPVLLTLAACGASHRTRAPEEPPAQRLKAAYQLLVDHRVKEGTAALDAIFDPKTFGTLSSDEQYRTLALAGRIGARVKQPKLAYGYLTRAAAMPQATYADHADRLSLAMTLGDRSAELEILATLASRWPDQVTSFNDLAVLWILDQARQLPPGAAFPALRALYRAHWHRKWGTEPSGAWRDLTLILLEKNLRAEAIEVSGHITDPYVLVAMRADRRLDTLRAANPGQFDVEAAARREFARLESQDGDDAKSLELKARELDLLIDLGHYAGALAMSDSIVSDIRSTNFPERLYGDYHERYHQILGARSLALQRLGLWDQAVEQLKEAAGLHEDGSDNVSDVIDLADLYCSLGRPDDARAALANVGLANTYGLMQEEAVRLDAAEQLHDTEQARRSLHYLDAHRADSPATYEWALIVANQPDRAEQALLAQLRDPRLREIALLQVQTFAPVTNPPRIDLLEARWHAVLARRTVQAAIARVGRIESYRLELH